MSIFVELADNRSTRPILSRARFPIQERTIQSLNHSVYTTFTKTPSGDTAKATTVTAPIQRTVRNPPPCIPSTQSRSFHQNSWLAKTSQSLNPSKIISTVSVLPPAGCSPCTSSRPSFYSSLSLLVSLLYVHYSAV